MPEGPRRHGRHMTASAKKEGRGAMTILCTGSLVPRARVSGFVCMTLADAAAAAGFDGVELPALHVQWAADDGIRPENFVEHYQRHHLDIVAVEVVKGWMALDLPDVMTAAQPIVDVATRAGARSIIAVAHESAFDSLTAAAHRLAALCDVAGDHGLEVWFEPVPWSAVPDVAEAARLFDATDRDNLGLVFDVWHWFRGPAGDDLDALRRFPGDRIPMVQLSDAPLAGPPDLVRETTTARLLPGEGAIDLRRVLEAIRHTGADPVFAPEVFSSELLDLGPHAMAVAVFEATKRALRPAPGWP
jgi:sugar phosphate isomerase/epimerase